MKMKIEFTNAERETMIEILREALKEQKTLSKNQRNNNKLIVIEEFLDKIVRA